MSNEDVVVTQHKKSKLRKVGSFLIPFAIVVSVNATAAAPTAPTAPDVSNVVSYIGLSVAAIVAIGSAKMIPAAAMWLYSSLTSMVKRG